MKITDLQAKINDLVSEIDSLGFVPSTFDVNIYKGSKGRVAIIAFFGDDNDSVSFKRLITTDDR